MSSSLICFGLRNIPIPRQLVQCHEPFTLSKKHLGYFILRMPQLSPTMSEGTITKWHVEETKGKCAYELLVDIAPDQLVKTESGLKNKNILEIEIQEDFILVKKLHKEGSIVEIDQPIAVICEAEDDLPMFETFKEHDIGKMPAVTWQAYLKNDAQAKEYFDNQGCT